MEVYGKFGRSSWVAGANFGRVDEVSELSFADTASTNLTLRKRQPFEAQDKQGCRTPNRLRRIYTELCCERFHLLAGFFEGAGAIDSFCCVAEFVLNWELRGDPAAGVVIAEAARAKALELLLGTAPGDHEAVEVLEVASFD